MGKKYIKTSSCYPERCHKSDYENIMKDFLASEKVQRNTYNILFLYLLVFRST